MKRLPEQIALDLKNIVRREMAELYNNSEEEELRKAHRVAEHFGWDDLCDDYPLLPDADAYDDPDEARDLQEDIDYMKRNEDHD